MDKQAAVNECVDYLFTDGFGSKAVRLVMIDSEGRYGAGWSKLPAADVIAKVYDAGYRSACGEWVRIEGPETLPEAGRLKWVTFLDDWDFGNPRVTTAGYSKGVWYNWFSGDAINGDVIAWQDYHIPEPFTDNSDQD